MGVGLLRDRQTKRDRELERGGVTKGQYRK